MAETLIGQLTGYAVTIGLIALLLFAFFLVLMLGIWLKYWISKQKIIYNSLVTQKIKEGKLKRLSNGKIIKINPDGKKKKKI